jgi:hypothetical protein
METWIGNLVDVGLLNRWADGTLALPESLIVADRATAASRRNGAVGGRPRRNETPEQARLRRAQGNLAMPIAGGRAETQETQNETRRPETPRVRAAAAACSESLSKQAAPDEDAMKLVDEVADMAGMEPVRSVHEAGPVLALLVEGFTPDIIRETVARIVARPGYTLPRSPLAYFAKIVREDAETAGLARSKPAEDPARATEIRAYLAAVERWKAEGSNGDAPTPPACLKEAA